MLSLLVDEVVDLFEPFDLLRILKRPDITELQKLGKQLGLSLGLRLLQLLARILFNLKNSFFVHAVLVDQLIKRFPLRLLIMAARTVEYHKEP